MAKLALADAYVRVFESGGATKRDCEVVLADLAHFSGFYAVAAGDSDPVALGRREGNREVFARILSHLRMGDFERRKLEVAAREEGIRSIYEGEI